MGTGVVSWRVQGGRKWAAGYLVLSKGELLCYTDTSGLRRATPQLKLYLRELPEPLLPYKLHSCLVKAAKKKGPHGEDIAKSMEVTLDEIKCPVVHATLEVLVMHLGRVAEAANRMDIDNLGLLFGQVLLWPDPMAPVDMKFL